MPTVVTSVDIARQAGVSQATVSRVINGRPGVATQTRARVEATMRDLGYTPNAVARGLVTNRTGLIGVTVANIINPFYPELLEAIAAQLAEHDLQMVVANFRGRDPGRQVQMLTEQRVDGVIMTSALLESDVVPALVARGLPVVLANRYVDDVECDVVIGDNAAGAVAVAEHLVGLGHERIAVINGLGATSTSRDRLGGFRASLEALGLHLDPELVRFGDYHYQTAYAEATTLLRMHERPTAIFCVNDLMAFATLNAARSLRISVPGEVSVVGFDDVRQARWESFDLTTVRQPLAEMARTAVELLVQRLASPEQAPRRLVFPSLLVRRSTTAPAGAGRDSLERDRRSRGNPRA